MRTLALVVARGGSKRVPGKNIRPLGGRPLILWSVDAAANISGICDVLVSTDDPAIAEVARRAGALVPWLRPAELANDATSSIDVCLHAVNWYETQVGGVDALLLLQPTSPFRSRHTILRGLELFFASGCRPVIGVSPAASHPIWCYRIIGETMRPFVNEGGHELRSQNLPPAYVVNGALYLITPDDLRTRRSFLAEDAVPLIIDLPEESLDIDTEWDWKIAESIVAMRGLTPDA